MKDLALTHLPIGARLRTSAPNLYLARLSPGSRPAQASALRWLANILGAASPNDLAWQALTRDQVLALREAAERRYAPRTARRMLCALRGVLEETWRQGWASREDIARLTEGLKIRGDSRPRPGRMLEIWEVDKIVQYATLRDRTLVLTMLGAGLRRAEAAGLNIGCVAAHGADGLRLRVIGKGRKQRDVFLYGTAARALEQYLLIRAEPPQHPIFPLTPAGVSKVLARLSRESGVSFTPHDLRRTYASRAFASGADIATIQATMGHADPRTTSSYDRRGDSALEEVARAVAF